MTPTGWMATLSRRERRTVWIAGVVLLGGLALRLGIGLSSYGSDFAREEASERELLAREVGLVRATPALRATFSDAADRLLEAAPELLGGASTEEAAAVLAAHVRNEAPGSLVRIRSTNPLPPDSVGPSLRRIRLSVEGDSDLEGVLGLIRRLQSGGKLLHIDNLDMAVAVRPVRTDEPEHLSFRLELAGYWLAGLAGKKPDQEPLPSVGASDR